MKILKLTENFNGKGALLEINLEEEEIRILVELAINHILAEAIDSHEKLIKGDAPDPPEPPPTRKIKSNVL